MYVELHNIWVYVDINWLLEIRMTLTPYMQVCTFLQLGKITGKDSMAVEVATDLMDKHNTHVHIR